MFRNKHVAKLAADHHKLHVHGGDGGRDPSSTQTLTTGGRKIKDGGSVRPFLGCEEEHPHTDRRLMSPSAG